MSTIITEATTASTCPQWCTRQHDSDDCICMHDHVVGDHAGVEIRINTVEACCAEHGDEGPQISIIDRGAADQLRPEDALQIAALLQAAALKVARIESGASL